MAKRPNLGKNAQNGQKSPKMAILANFGVLRGFRPPRGLPGWSPGGGFTSTPRAGTPGGGSGAPGGGLGGLRDPPGPREGVWDPVGTLRDPGTGSGSPSEGVLHQPLAPGPRGSPGSPGGVSGPREPKIPQNPGFSPKMPKNPVFGHFPGVPRKTPILGLRGPLREGLM